MFLARCAVVTVTATGAKRQKTTDYYNPIGDWMIVVLEFITVEFGKSENPQYRW